MTRSRRSSHTSEQARRAFRHGEVQQLGDLPDSPRLRHYRALLAIRRGKARDVVLDDVDPDGRAVAEDLLGLIAAKAETGRLSDRLTERILADPTVWPVLIEIAGSTSLDATPELQSRFPAFTEWLALHQAREHLFVGAWREAVAAADRCLALAAAEPVRDEALNLKACGLHNLGADDQAIAALEEAIEGDYSDSLLANIGIVAAGLRPEVAARHLGVLIAEAPTTPMRVAAARRALSIWSTSDTASWRNSDDSPLPDVFQDALRELVIAGRRARRLPPLRQPARRPRQRRGSATKPASRRLRIATPSRPASTSRARPACRAWSRSWARRSRLARRRNG